MPACLWGRQGLKSRATSSTSRLDIVEQAWQNCLMTNNNISLTITAFGATHEVHPEFGAYSNGRLAISFFDEEGPYAKLTVNMPDDHLDPGEVFIKDWSENEPLALALLDAGWIEYTGREVQAGFAIAKVARLAGPLLTIDFEDHF